MEPHQRTEFTARGLAVRSHSGEAGDIKHIDLFSGELHYWRIDRRDWRSCIHELAKLGVSAVSTYVPWSVHETRSGRFDWSENRDLGAFLDQVRDAGMYAIVKPGPHINAELTFFGFPERVLHDRDCLAVTGRDTLAWMPIPPRMFPIPSYASRAFQDEVTRWFAAVGEIVAPRLAPDGPIVAIQVDNEAQLFFRLGAYDVDYHPDALAWWDEFSDGAKPPRAWSTSDAQRCVTWVRFKQEYMARSLVWLGAALDSAGVQGIARYHNLPPSEPSLVDMSRLTRAVACSHSGVVGMDFYHKSADYRVYRRRALYLAGSAEPLSFSPEVGVGGPLWLLPMTPDDQRNTLLGLLSTGMRGFNLYMAVARERWYGGAIDSAGDIQPAGVWYKTLLAALKRFRWTTLRRSTPVALIWSRTDMRFASASSVVDPITPVLAEFARLGPAGSAELGLDSDGSAHRRWLAACESALDLAQIPYHIVDDSTSPARLACYRVVIAPTLNRVDRAMWRCLHELANTDTVVVIGPHTPSLDEYGLALDDAGGVPAGAGLIRADSIDDLNGFADDLVDLAGELPDYWLAETEDTDISVFEDEHAHPVVVFVANRTDTTRTAELTTPDGIRLSDVITGKPAFRTDDDVVRVNLAPYEVRMFEVTSLET